MSASTQTDALAEAWKRSVTQKFNTGAGLDIPHPNKPPRVSIYATHELARSNKSFLTWKPELRIWGVPSIKRTLIDLMSGDNFEQLDKVYQYEYAVAELAEHWEVRLEKAKTELEEWKHVAKEGRTRFDALIKSESRDNVAVAWQDALLDRSQGRVIRWTEIVAQEQRQVQLQKTKVDELFISASKALALLEQRKESIIEQGREQRHGQGPKPDVGWFVMVYLTARENAAISVSGQLIVNFCSRVAFQPGSATTLRPALLPCEIQGLWQAIKMHSCNLNSRLAIEITLIRFSLWRPCLPRKHCAFLQLQCDCS